LFERHIFTHRVPCEQWADRTIYVAGLGCPIRTRVTNGTGPDSLTAGTLTAGPAGRWRHPASRTSPETPPGAAGPAPIMRDGPATLLCCTAPVAQGIEHRPPEAGAQVRILPGALQPPIVGTAIVILAIVWFMSSHGDVLREVMLKTGITQSELSRISGVRQPSISQYLSGRGNLSDRMLDRLLACMGYHLEIVRRPVRQKLDRPAERSWRLHRRLATHLSRETLNEWRPIMWRNIRDLRDGVRGQPHLRNLDRWQRLIQDSDLSGLRQVMTGLDTDAVQMREVSPMRGLLSQQERSEALASR
jgi:transcriptional regulator with XRE-family HTH domain